METIIEGYIGIILGLYWDTGKTETTILQLMQWEVYADQAQKAKGHVVPVTGFPKHTSNAPEQGNVSCHSFAIHISLWASGSAYTPPN